MTSTTYLIASEFGWQTEEETLTFPLNSCELIEQDLVSVRVDDKSIGDGVTKATIGKHKVVCVCSREIWINLHMVILLILCIYIYMLCKYYVSKLIIKLT